MSRTDSFNKLPNETVDYLNAMTQLQMDQMAMESATREYLRPARKSTLYKKSQVPNNTGLEVTEKKMNSDVLSPPVDKNVLENQGRMEI